MRSDPVRCARASAGIMIVAQILSLLVAPALHAAQQVPDVTHVPLASKQAVVDAIARHFPHLWVPAGIGRTVNIELLVGPSGSVIGSGAVHTQDEQLRMAAREVARAVEFAEDVPPGLVSYRLALLPDSTRLQLKTSLECYTPAVLTAVVRERSRMRANPGWGVIRDSAEPPPKPPQPMRTLVSVRSGPSNACSEVHEAWINDPVAIRTLDRAGIGVCLEQPCAGVGEHVPVVIEARHMTWPGREWVLSVTQIDAGGDWTVWCDGDDCRVMNRPRPIH